MKVFSAGTSGKWLERLNTVPLDESGNPKADPAGAEIRRVLSDVFRCNSLVVVAGLGASRCVTKRGDPSKCLAPTMLDLWSKVEETHGLLGIPDWETLLKLVRHPPDERNLEALLSQCRLAESFLGGDDLKSVQTFIALAEHSIYTAVDFVSEELELPIHVEFLRRIARRSNRKSRTKVFTTNYDRCFEEAARQGRYVVVDLYGDRKSVV